MKNIALTVLHGNITNSNSKYVGNAEALEIAKLISSLSNVKLDVLTCLECDGCIHVNEDFNINMYDALFVVNGSLNMYGGLEIETATTIYKLLHNFNNQIYYILTDTSLPFIDYYNFIKSKDFSKNYTKDDFSLKNDIIILSQFKNIAYIKSLHKNINIKDIIYVPFALWKIENLNSIAIDSNVEKTSDLIYGGSFRSGKRAKKMLEYFFNKKNIKVKIFGNMNINQFSKYKYNIPPEFIGKVKNSEVVNLNNSSISTIIIGDSQYNNNTVTLRVYEALLSNCVIFIDNDFDIKHSIFKGEDWLYVRSGDELQQKILKLKKDEELRKYYLNNNIKLINKLREEKTLSKKLNEIIFMGE